MIAVDGTARLLRHRAGDRRAGRALGLAALAALLLHLALLGGLVVLPPGLLSPARSGTPVPPREATIDVVQNAMPSTGDAPAGGSGNTIEHATPAAARPRAAAAPAGAPNAARLAPAAHGTVTRGNPAPPMPRTPARMAQKAQPAQAQPARQVDIRLNDFGDDGGQSGGDATTPSAPDPRAKNHLPPYPARAAMLGETGTVVAMVRVLPNGHAGAVIIVRSSGWPDLDSAVVRTLLHWRFRPAVAHGVAVESQVPVTMHFTG